MRLSNLDKARSCKIGTIPALVHVHGRDVKKITTGAWIRIREADGEPWTRVLVRDVHPDGYFVAER